MSTTAPEPSSTDGTNDAADVEVSYLAVIKAGFRGVVELPPVTDAELIGFGYELCADIGLALTTRVDPKEAAAEAIQEALLPNGMVDGGKGEIIIVRNVLQKSATEYLCPDASYQAWASAFESGIFEAFDEDSP